MCVCVCVYIYIYIYIRVISINKVNIAKGVGNSKQFTVAPFSRKSIVMVPFISQKTVSMTFFIQ